jgi:hypothetical protein
MDIVNIKVKHKSFGVGTITEFDGNSITVQFENKKSIFIYPDAFDKFITAEEPSIQDAIKKEIVAAKQASEEKRKADFEAYAANAQKIDKSAKRPRTTARGNIADGFGPDYNVRYLAKHPILNYHQVEEQFGIRITGFGRGINRTESTVVLISSVDKKKGGFVYHDHWTTDGDYIYSGEGKTGDQKMSSGNSAIVSASNDGKVIHLFVKFSPQEYYYQGMFKLVDYTYENEKDEDGNTRKEYKFRLRKRSVEE